MIVIQIKGVPGSGKTFICSKLPSYIKCLDTDDYSTKAYNKLCEEGDIPSSEKNVEKLAKKMLIQDIKKYKTVVVVGITIDIPNPTHKYFIKMTKDELEISYKRVVIREIEKYKEITKPYVIKHIKSLNPEEISYFLRYKYHINAVEPVDETFEIYKRKYRYAMSFEKRNGFSVKSQENIINDIKKIID